MAGMYVITGATGNIGRAIAETLLTQGQPVRVIGRDAAKLQALVDRGAQARAGSLDDAAFLREAFAGATAVFVMTPPAYTAEDVRARANEVGAVVGEALAALADGLGARDGAVIREISKLHEETVTGTLAELAARYADAPPRGEIVIVVGPPGEADAASDEALDAALLHDAADH